MSHSHTRTPAFAPRHSAASARRRLTHFPFAVCLIALATLTCRAKEASYRLYQGVTIYVNNPSGKPFDIKLKVRDLNLFSKGPREVLFKVYDPDGKTPVREIIPDEPTLMRPLLEKFAADVNIDAVLLTGGTGVSSRDQTYETVTALLTRQLPGYGELFRMLSFQEIGPAAMLSRATGGLMGRTVVLTMPGSPAAVRLAMERIIVPELRHLVREARR